MAEQGEREPCPSFGHKLPGMWNSEKNKPKNTLQDHKLHDARAKFHPQPLCAGQERGGHWPWHFWRNFWSNLAMTQLSLEWLEEHSEIPWNCSCEPSLITKCIWWQEQGSDTEFAANSSSTECTRQHPPPQSSTSKPLKILQGITAELSQKYPR